MITDLAQSITSKWWTFLVRGILALALAFFVFSQPAATAEGLVYIVSAFFILSGIAAIAAGVSFTGVGQGWLLILMGLMQAALGIIMIAQPSTGPLALAYLVAVYAISSGLMEISSAIAFRNYITNEGWWIFLGIVTLAVGVYIVIRPDLGVIALVYTIGIYAALAAGSLFALAFRLKSAGGEIARHGRTGKPEAAY